MDRFDSRRRPVTDDFDSSTSLACAVKGRTRETLIDSISRIFRCFDKSGYSGSRAETYSISGPMHLETQSRNLGNLPTVPRLFKLEKFLLLE